MVDTPGVITDDGSVFALKQMYLLCKLNLHEDRARQLIGFVGPRWAVATFRCYLTNRKRHQGREHLLPLLIAMHTEGMKGPNEFIDRMRLMGLVPIDPAGASRQLEFIDCDRILYALRFFAQRY